MATALVSGSNVGITTRPTPGRKHGTGSQGALARPPLVTFTTDFGSGSPLVAAMKAMVLAGCPTPGLVDLSHEGPRFHLPAGAFMVFARTPPFGSELCA